MLVALKSLKKYMKHIENMNFKALQRRSKKTEISEKTGKFKKKIKTILEVTSKILSCTLSEIILLPKF